MAIVSAKVKIITAIVDIAIIIFIFGLNLFKFATFFTFSFIVSRSGNASSNLLPFQLVFSNSLAFLVISYVLSFLFCAATFFTVEVTFEITLHDIIISAINIMNNTKLIIFDTSDGI